MAWPWNWSFELGSYAKLHQNRLIFAIWQLFLARAHLQFPTIGWMGFLYIYRQEIGHVPEFSHDGEELVHPCSENRAGPTAEVDDERTVASAKF